MRASTRAVQPLESSPQPQGLLSINLFACSGGETVLNYAQWTSDEAYHEFARIHGRSRIDKIDRAVPGIERRCLYRSRAREHAPVAGCVVIVSVQF